MEYTGRYLVGSRSADAALPRMLRDTAGLRIASSSDFPRGPVNTESLGGADGVFFERLGVAVTRSAPDQAESLTRSGSGLLIIERERIVYVFDLPQRDVVSAEAPSRIIGFGSRGVAGIDTWVCNLTPSGIVGAKATPDESVHTWGLASTRVLESSRTGRGVKLAVLDTGFDLTHPDFAGRKVVAKSFIEGEDAQDGHSHGTHCIGTAAGPAQPPAMPRYGIASGAEIHAGKVLANAGHGTDGSILAGIDWALQSGCRVISMSLGSATQIGQAYSVIFEAAAERALAANCIIVAAAGNESDRRNNIINPVGHPANCPSILAVGAVDADMQIAFFSTRGMTANGGEVDIAGPGVDVYSTEPPHTHGRKSGTSMACPHVAGIAALYVEAYPNATAREIWKMLTQYAKKIALDPADAGAGFVQAPR